MNLASRSGAIPGLALAGREQRAGEGLGAGPILPPGVGMPGMGMPRASLGGTSEPTGNPVAAIAAMMASAGGMGGGRPKGLGSRGSEKPSFARSAAISRRLNGNPSRGTELKGL